MSAPVPAVADLRIRHSTDPYLLRTLLWCGPCDVPMHPQPARRQRTYKCGQGCRRVAVPAEPVEAVAWNAAERRATLTAITLPYRQFVLELLLVKAILIADAPDDLRFIWRT